MVLHFFVLLLRYSSYFYKGPGEGWTLHIIQMAQALQTSVIIVGAGPAGWAASVFLSKKGIAHIVLEKEVFPRDKVCGDGCSGKTTYVLQQANPEWLQEIYQAEQTFTQSHGITFIAPNGKVLNVPFTPDQAPTDVAPSFTAPRLQLDYFLFQKLASPYCTVYQQAAIKNIERKADGTIEVAFVHDRQEYTVSAPLIVGADGDKSLVRKTFLQTAAVKSDVIAVRSYYKGVTGFDSDHFIEIHFLSDVLPGYFWIFPLANDRANVGVGMPSKWIRKKGINLRELLLHTVQNHPAIRHRFDTASLEGKIQGWGLPIYTKKEPVSGDRFLLTGDAARLIDPFSGEGIGNALFSGMTAATAIEKALALQQYEAAFFKTHYDEPLFKGIGDELKISSVLQHLYRFPGVLNFLANKVHQKPSRIQVISKMFADIELRKQLQKPSFYTKLLFR